MRRLQHVVAMLVALAMAVFPLSGALGVPAAAAAGNLHAAQADHAAHASAHSGHVAVHAAHKAAPAAHAAHHDADATAGHHGAASDGKVFDCCGLFCHAFQPIDLAVVTRPLTRLIPLPVALDLQLDGLGSAGVDKPPRTTDIG